MQVKQTFSLLIYPKRENKKQEWGTIYARITIDGLDDEFSLSIKIKYNYWLPESKTVEQEHPSAKTINSRIKAAEMDLQRHFLLVQAKNGIALPQAVRQSYQTPINGRYLIKCKEEYGGFELTLVELLKDVIDPPNFPIKESEDIEKRINDIQTSSLWNPEITQTSIPN
jgi:hypothetical protein